MVPTGIAAQDPSPDMRCIRVIFADDNDSLRLLATYTLSARRGFALVDPVSDGSKVLELLDQHEVDCIVLDVDMPILDGLATLAVLQQRCPAVPVVLLTGFAGPVFAARARAAGAAALLDKGQGLGQLRSTISRVVAEAAQ
jgi:CheY-like chemotaxis protein